MSKVYRCWLDGKPIEVRLREPDRKAIAEMVELVCAMPTRYSLLKLMARSPWAYLRGAVKALEEGPEERLAQKLGAGRGIKSEDALRFGTAVHRLVLGNPRGVVVYNRAEADARLPEEKRAPSKGVTRNGEAWEAFRAEHEAEGRVILIQSEMDEAQAMADQLLGSEPACDLLFGGEPILEERIEWQLADGVRISSRPDVRLPGKHVTDLKSCADSSPAAFTKTIFRMTYHAQAETYCRAAEHADGVRPGEANILAIDRYEPPRIFHVPGEALELGAQLLGAWAGELATCVASRHFPFDTYHLATPPAYLVGDMILPPEPEDFE